MYQPSRAAGLALAALLGLSSSGRAADGVIEINQTCAEATGCVPGDTPGLPVTLSQPGSYVLTSSLDHDPATHGNTPIVEVTDDVSLDLNGFAIRSTTTCTASACPSGSVHGISGGFSTGVTVKNGSIIGVDGDCVRLGSQGRVEDLVIRHCGLHGVSVGSSSVVTDSTIVSTGRNGLAPPGFNHVGIVYRGCTFAQNGLRGDVIGSLDLISSVWGARATGGNFCEDRRCGDGRPRMYLTQAAVQGDQVLTACETGFHLASVLEVRGSGGLPYDTTRGRTTSSGAGWVDPTGSPLSACSGWTSTSGFGARISFSEDFFWTSSHWNGSAVVNNVLFFPLLGWEVSNADCSSSRPVWCIED